MKRTAAFGLAFAVVVLAPAAGSSYLTSVATAQTEPLIDLVMVKGATSPTPLNGVVNYSLSVMNNGPDTATNVQVADPAPLGITYVGASPAQGVCAVTTPLIVCALDQIAAGQTVTIAIIGHATAVGLHTNTATVTGSGGRESNPADNIDSAVTRVRRPLTAPEPVQCLALAVSPHMLIADGKPDRIMVKVTQGKRPVVQARVTVYGEGLRKSERTDATGAASFSVNVREAGLLTVTVLEGPAPVCGVKRIGVVEVFFVPLTG